MLNHDISGRFHLTADISAQVLPNRAPPTRRRTFYFILINHSLSKLGLNRGRRARMIASKGVLVEIDCYLGGVKWYWLAIADGS